MIYFLVYYNIFWIIVFYATCRASASRASRATGRNLCSCLYFRVCAQRCMALFADTPAPAPLVATPTVTTAASFIKIMHCMAAPKLGWCCLTQSLSLSHSLPTTYSLCLARHVKRHFVSAAVSGTSSLWKWIRGREGRQCMLTNVPRSIVCHSLWRCFLSQWHSPALGPTFAITSKCIAYCGASFMWVQQFAYAITFPRTLSLSFKNKYMIFFVNV